MNMAKKIDVQGTAITVISVNNEDYISLTDMLKAKDGDFFISDWLRNRNTIEFLGIWESVHNPIFNYGEFAIIKSQAGLNSYKISVKEWTEKTNAVGLKATAGRYGGTYAHIDIAFEFGMWISAEFAKINYRIHTDAIKEKIIPAAVTREQATAIYASEADILNIAMFGMTAQQWRDSNPGKAGNIRDEAMLEQLVVLSNLESVNSVLIHQGVSQSERLTQLNRIAITQMKSLIENSNIKRLKQ